ncbi:MAG: NAD(P)H-hydrate dehydratase [Kiritimatiellae bacterium]|nr:NAD(P)H-hydrate dehydratase [Kiritimatiellia bacterium]
MIAVSSAEMRELERRLIEEYRIQGVDLMERAGMGVATCVHSFSSDNELTDPRVLCIAGRGNNGGDAFVAARYLKKLGMDVAVWIAGDVAQITGDAAFHLSKLKAAKVRVTHLPTLDDWRYAIKEADPVEIIVDGILGTGAHGPARGPVAGAIQFIRARAANSLVISIDVPSGLNADTGQAEGDVVSADLTATIGLPKVGLFAPSATNWVGAVEVVELGLPPALLPRLTEKHCALIGTPEIRSLFRPRARNTHKGDYGHGVLIGGGGPYTGAISLAAQAALRSGIGLLSAVVPRSHRDLVAISAVEAMVMGAPETEAGSFDERAIDVIRSHFTPNRVFAVGSGMTRSPSTRVLVEAILREATGPLVVDADALSAMAGEPEIFRQAKQPVILTPHPGEAATLLGTTAQAVQADRMAAARELAARSGAVVVLKGAGTLIARSGEPIHICTNGNPGMARGGMGDVLTGVILAFLAQGFDPLNAARVAVYFHGASGDIAARRGGQLSATPLDVIKDLGYAYHAILAR